MGLQLLRVYLPLATFYLYDARGLSPLLTAGCSLLFFGLGLTAPALAGRFGWRRALRGVVALLAAVRIAEQLSRSPALDVWLAAAGTAFLAVLLALTLLAATQPPGVRWGLGFAALLALAAETAIRTLAGTFDLSWRQDPVATALALAIAAAALAAAAPMRPDVDHPRPAARPWVWAAVGAWLGLYLLVYSNPAHLAARAAIPLDRAGRFVLGAWVLALLVAALIPLMAGRLWRTVEAGALAAAGGWVAIFGGDDAWFGYVIGGPGMAVLLIDLYSARPRESCPGRGAGGAGLVLLLLLYLSYGRLDQPFGSSEAAIAAFALATLLAVALLGAWRASPERLPVPWRYLPAGVAAALVLGAVSMLLPSSPRATADRPAPVPEPGPIRVLTYNLHQGFSTAGRLDPAALAEEILAESPDVVALQEVSRGWLVTGGLDLHTWLTRSLAMPGVFAGTADPQWGNAVLTGLPVLASSYHPLPPADLPLRRGALDVTVATGEGPLRLLCIHFHHRGADHAVRLAQTEELLRIWGGSPTTLLLGDFNALPESDSIRRLRAAGLHDASALLPPAERTTITRDSERQIDWIFATPDLTFEATRVRFTESSDHLPLATSVYRRPATGAAENRGPASALAAAPGER